MKKWYLFLFIFLFVLPLFGFQKSVQKNDSIDFIKNERKSIITLFLGVMPLEFSKFDIPICTGIIFDIPSGKKFSFPFLIKIIPFGETKLFSFSLNLKYYFSKIKRDYHIFGGVGIMNMVYPHITVYSGWEKYYQSGVGIALNAGFDIILVQIQKRKFMNNFTIPLNLNIGIYF